MSLFRFGSIRSPPRRPTVLGSEQSPFCTSPSQLQEVTLDPNASANGTIPFSVGVRSPGKTSPIRGQGMKGYEDQLSQLKKENFNLKLRIYFLEERMGHMNDADDKEDPIKKNIELKVEAETLRKEVSHKQDLICQAAKALDIMEEQHRVEQKRIQEEREMEKGMLETRIQELENILKECQSRMRDSKFTKLEDSTALISEAFGLSPLGACVDHHTHEEVEKLQHQIEELESQVQQLECSLQEETVRSSQLEGDLQEAQQEAERVGVRCQGLELELKQRDCKLEDLVQELEQRGQELAGSNLRIRTLEEALSAKEPEIQIKVQELCERDRIIEEKQSQIEQQNKVIVEIQITLDEKQRQIEALRSSLAARDSSIADLEGRLAKAKAIARNLEAKLDASVHEARRLREEVETLKAQQKRSNNRSREHIQQELDLLSPVRRKSGMSHISDEKTSPGRRTRPSSDEDGTLRKKMLELKEKEGKLKVMEDKNRELSVQLEAANKEKKTYETRLVQLETECRNSDSKFQEVEKKLKEKETKTKKLEEDNMKACHAIKGFMKRTKETGREMEQLKSELKKKDRRIRDLVSELNEIRDAYNKATWEARQLQAQARVQGGGGMPGAFENVRDMTEEENERLWAEVEDKNKKLSQLTKERENFSLEMEKQVQALVTSLKEKENLLQDYEKKVSLSTNELTARDNHIKDLEDNLGQLKKELEALQARYDKLEEKGSGEGISVEKNTNSLPEEFKLELEDKKREVERLNEELQKRNGNLQELVNKELWDKNREIEKLQDRLNNICKRKELEIMSLEQQVGARDFQLKMLQDKVAELGIHMNLPSIVMRELQQMPVTFNQHVHLKQSSNEDSLKTETGDVHRDEVGTSLVCTAPTDEVSYLRDQLQTSIEERKYLCSKVEELRERLRNTPERDSDSRTLRSECARLREEIDRANVWRKEAGEACSLLTRRLEELASFLSSLLSCPEQLGGLGSKHKQLLKQAVERSMELSRTLSVSLCINNQDISSNSLPPLMDSFSSILMSAGDTNFSFGDTLHREEEDEASSFDPGQQENLISSGISPHETTPSSQYLRSSGTNSEIAHIQMRDSVTSEENYPSTGKIVEEQANIIAQLRSQVEVLTHEIKQKDIGYSKSQKDVIGGPESFAAPGTRSRTTSPSKSGKSSVWKPRTETEKLGDFEETKDSLSSMTFYNSHHLNNSISEHWSNESQSAVPVVSEQSIETKGAADVSSVLHQEKTNAVPAESAKKSASSSPVKNTRATEAEFCGMVNDRPSPKRQDYQKSTKSPLSHKMCRSVSASAVALGQLQQQSVQRQDVAIGSLSESEAWSEPDRNVSLARIGLNEESAKVVLSPGAAGGNNCAVGSSTRPRNGRVIQEESETSESSEETAHEISRFQGKRGRSDTGEVRRLQNRLRALEQVNEALRAELTILHQVNPPPPPPLTPPPEIIERPLTRDTSMNTSTREEKMDKSTSVELTQNKEIQNGSSVTIPVYLLDQIRCQREKLESSLYHNEFIRRQLEDIMTSLSDQGDDNMKSLWQKMKETTEQLEEARHQSQDLETRLHEMGTHLEASKEQARLASEANEQVQVTRQTVTIIQEQMSNLEARLQEKDNEILERKCQMLELENRTKQQSIETDKIMQEAAKLKQEAEQQIKAAEIIKLEAENKFQQAKQLILEAEKTKLDAESKIKDLEKQFKDAETQRKEAEIQSGAVNVEKEKLQKEFEIIKKDSEMIQMERDAIKKEKETIQREKEIICKERESLQKEKEVTRKEVEESVKEIQSIAHDAKVQKEEAEQQMKVAKKKIQEAEVLKQEAEVKVKSAEEVVIMIEKRSAEMLQMKTKEMEVQLAQKLHEAEKNLEEKEWVSKAEMEKKVQEYERLGQELEAGLKLQVENAKKHEKEIKAEAEKRIRDTEEKSKERELELKKCLQESEKHFREKDCELRKQLDEMKLSTSQAALERTRLANEKLRLEQEVRRHEAREAELVRETKEAENHLRITKEQLEKEIMVLHHQKSDLEKCVKELEAANIELKERLSNLYLKERTSYSILAESNSGHISGPDSTSSLPRMKMGRISPGSYSSGLDLLTGEGGSLPNSPWGTTGTVSLEYGGSQTEDREHCRDRNRRGSDGGRSGGLTSLSNLVLQHGFGRQRSELSDYMSEDQALEEYEALFTQTRSSSYWVTLTEQHSTPSVNVPGDPSVMRNTNSSPDLGIESDQGRFSSLEATSSGMQTDTSKVLRTMEGYTSDLEHTLTPVVISSSGDRTGKSYKELEQENIVLKRRLTRTHRALEETLAHLTAANQKKKQVERAICKQLHKTHHILKRARVNLDTETGFASPPTEELE